MLSACMVGSTGLVNRYAACGIEVCGIEMIVIMKVKVQDRIVDDEVAEWQNIFDPALVARDEKVKCECECES